MTSIERLALGQPVTLLAGDNGSGKSTVLEAIAAAVGFDEQGGELERLGELPAVPRSILRDALAPVLSGTKPRNGYYLRAESFFNVAAFVDSGERFAPDLSLYGDVPLQSSPTASRSSRWRRTASVPTGCTCLTSPRRRCR